MERQGVRLTRWPECIVARVHRRASGGRGVGVWVVVVGSSSSLDGTQYTSPLPALRSSCTLPGAGTPSLPCLFVSAFIALGRARRKGLGGGWGHVWASLKCSDEMQHDDLLHHTCCVMYDCFVYVWGTV